MARSADVSVSVYAPKLATSLSIDVSPTSGTAPLNISVSGYLTETATGYGVGLKPINVYVNGSLYGSVDTKSNGFYATYITLTSQGTYTIHTEFGGDVTYEGCEVCNHATVSEGIAPSPIVPIITILGISALIGGMYYLLRKH